ncbi:MAG: hypothetical protein ABL955_14560 [Elusimicrobiota bacterium]
MDANSGRFRDLPPVGTNPEEVARIAKLPTLSVDEEVLIKGAFFRVKVMKANGKVRLIASRDRQIDFEVGERIDIKGVLFRVSFSVGKKMGARMVPRGI